MRLRAAFVVLATLVAAAYADDVATSPPSDPNGPISFAGVTLPPTTESWWRKSAAVSADGNELAGAYAQPAAGDSAASVFVYTPAEAFDAHVELIKRDVLRTYTATLDDDRPATFTFADGPHAGRVASFSYATAFAQNNGTETPVKSKLIAVPLAGGAVFVARVTWPADTTTGPISDASLLKTISIAPATQPAGR